MNKRQQHTGLYYFFGLNKGTWVLILVHLFILLSLVVLFSAIIEKMQNY
ncbi:MAG TPA: hypothetical protein VHA56_14360 [Mucilaginibacter sp.]|jgi:hypothetical protein|nr:hypothetical protein [Mucilaginibacter sp.]HTI61836.1 hypothetical protein [Mucilaginibacter sp.]HVW97150.1 hypothetical protein [Mucilaginibacter sp.]